MSRISASQCTFPKMPYQFFSSDISPSMLYIPLIGDFIQNYWLFILFTPLIRIFRCSVQILPLYAAMGYPRSCMIIEINTVMNRSLSF